MRQALLTIINDSPETVARDRLRLETTSGWQLRVSMGLLFVTESNNLQLMFPSSGSDLSRVFAFSWRPSRTGAQRARVTRRQPVVAPKGSRRWSHMTP
jgi:hypothetical protein